MHASVPVGPTCQRIGNSQPIAAKHYLQVTDEHFSKTVRNPVQLTARSKPRPRRYRVVTGIAVGPTCGLLSTIPSY